MIDDVFIPNHEASNRAIVDFSRNPRDFASPNYLQIVPVANRSGYFLEDSSSDSQEWKAFHCTQYVFPFASSDKQAQAIREAMQLRAKKAQAILFDEKLWPQSISAANLGLRWQLDLYAKKIAEDSLGQVQKSDLVLVVSSFLSGLLPLGLIRDNGWKVVIEKDWTCQRSQTDAILLARPNGLQGEYGKPSFSTLTTFCYEEMIVETHRDARASDNGRIVEEYSIELTSGSTGFLLKNIDIAR